MTQSVKKNKDLIKAQTLLILDDLTECARCPWQLVRTVQELRLRHPGETCFSAFTTAFRPIAEDGSILDSQEKNA